jgi:large subunit ribosomal protein L23
MKSVLISPHITEKATKLAEKNQYVFRVEKGANKNEIKKEIENLYKVKVLDVKIINVPAKERRLGQISGWKKGFKKAIIKIKEGQKIEVLPR